MAASPAYNYQQYRMSDRPLGAEAVSRPKRPYRPPIGIPAPIKEHKWMGVLWSVALHAIIIILVLLPVLIVADVGIIPQGAGGDGPAGGGGGGSRGTGGAPVQERLQYIQVAPTPPAAVVPPVEPIVTPPVVVPPPQPIVPDVPQLAVKELPAMSAPSIAPGTGGGTGNDGTAGNGPGSGGGVGSGIGTGRGSGVGPGTGGGNTANYAPTATELFIPPMPIPDKVKGSEVTATFDVDSSGKVLSVTFTPTRDGGYNKKLKEVFSGFKFRPAVRPDGTPIRALAQLAFLF